MEENGDLSHVRKLSEIVDGLGSSDCPEYHFDQGDYACSEGCHHSCGFVDMVHERLLAVVEAAPNTAKAKYLADYLEGWRRSPPS